MTSKVRHMQAFIQAFIYADAFGKFIFFSLFALSIISWAFLSYKLWIVIKLKQAHKQYESFFDCKNTNLMEIKVPLNPKPHPYVQLHNVLKKNVLEILQKNRSSTKAVAYLSSSDLSLIETQLSSTISNQSKLLQKNLFILPTVTALAPFLGLLGTVWGFLITFSGLQIHSISGPNGAILSGFSMALSTTVLGLIVTIPSLIAHNYLKHSITELLNDMEKFSQGMLSSIKIQYRNVDIRD